MVQKEISGSVEQSNVINAIPLKTAQNWAKRWAKQEGNYNQHHHVKAFLIPKVDVLEVLKEGVDAVRAYLGVDDNGVEKLMIIGTKLDPLTGVYVDMITETEGDGDTAAASDDIYDFTQPCPTACDPESPMFK
ncbi:hypothetical protein [Flavobacterium sp. LB2P44]|uniref:hypothetical protein n=1 Tax=Flavobacterium sp. LB2P44 TaxID=3401713 RepID=UPI003AB0F4ED